MYTVATRIKEKKNKPWGSDRVQNGDDGRNVNSSPNWYIHFRNQNGEGKNNTVEEESNHMGNDLPDKEETVDHINFLPEFHFLQQQQNNNPLLKPTILLSQNLKNFRI